MRATLALASLTALALAGSAAASDYMLPLLLEPEVGQGVAPSPGSPGPGQAPQGLESRAAANPVAMGVALVAAALVVALAFALLARAGARA